MEIQIKDRTHRSAPASPPQSLEHVGNTGARAQNCGLVGVIERICGTQCFTQLGDHILPALANQISAHGATFRHVNNADASDVVLLRSACYGIPAADMYHLQRHYARLDPLARLSSALLGDKSVFRPRDVIDHRHFDEDELFCQILARSGVHHVVCIFIEVDAGAPFFFGFHRPASARPFSERELAALGHCLKPLQSTLSRLHFKQQLDEIRAHLGTDRPDRDDLAAVVLDEALQPIYIDLRGRPALARLVARKQLLDQLHEQCASLRESDERAGSKHVILDSIRVEVRRDVKDDGERFLLFLSTPADAGLGQLTSREWELVEDICRGLPNKEIARQRQISVNTVQNHLRAIFAKMGVDSRTKLMRMAWQHGGSRR